MTVAEPLFDVKHPLRTFSELLICKQPLEPLIVLSAFGHLLLNEVEPVTGFHSNRPLFLNSLELHLG